MYKILKIIINGVEDIADVYVYPRNYKYPTRQGFKADHENLRGDVEKVGEVMETAARKYVQQTNTTSGYRS